MLNSEIRKHEPRSAVVESCFSHLERGSLFFAVARNYPASDDKKSPIVLTIYLCPSRSPISHLLLHLTTCFPWFCVVSDGVLGGVNAQCTVCTNHRCSQPVQTYRLYPWYSKHILAAYSYTAVPAPNTKPKYYQIPDICYNQHPNNNLA